MKNKNHLLKIFLSSSLAAAACLPGGFLNVPAPAFAAEAVCPACRGTQNILVAKGSICPTCHGTGQELVDVSCQSCGGSGKSSTHPQWSCPNCAGMGSYQVKKTCPDCLGGVIEKDGAVRCRLCAAKSQQKPTAAATTGYTDCHISLNALSRDKASPGDTIEMYGVWGESQGEKIPCINKGNMNKLEVLYWSYRMIRVRIPPHLKPGIYRIGVYCNDLSLGGSYASGWKDFEIKD